MKLLLHCLILIVITPLANAQETYDLDNGNAAVELVIPTVIPIALQDVSASAGDATLVLRFTTLLTNAWFDASAPYHPTAVGVYSRLERRPEQESNTNRNINIALLYASLRVLESLLPARNEEWRSILLAAGLDPTNESTDTSTPEGIGNVAGAAVVAARESDGMNQLGTEGGREFNPVPYADYTGYQPVNTPYRLRKPGRWQPDIQRKGLGLYRSQVFVTPQYALVEPYSFLEAEAFGVPAPLASFRFRSQAYVDQANEVLEASANLTEEQKLLAEFYDNKFDSLGLSAVVASIIQGQSLLEFIALDFAVNMAAFDAGIVTWQEKVRYDAVRPFSAIRYIYGDELVEAYGGPGVGTTLLPASQWQSYLEEADHPEYPSATTCFCSAHVTAARRMLGNDNLGYVVEKPAGSSFREPGITPAQDTQLVFNTWTDFEDSCGQSRVWAGVHFQAAVDESRELCGVFGDLAADYVDSLLDGSAPERGSTSGRQW